MAGWLNSAMSWLGLVDDMQSEDARYAEQTYSDVADATAVDETTDPLETVSSVTATELPSNITRITDISSRRAAESKIGMEEPRPIVDDTIPVILYAFSYSDMKLIGEQFRSGKAVVMNLTGIGDRKEIRKLIDFSSGMAFALDGNVAKIADKVFLLRPHGLQIADGFMERLDAEVARSA
ncbi:MAG: cell division protein SepF [Propionibacteriaceae bacterium]|jgi:cell division inhibitor SepF|nr:cell division protein SepF [Propionibacteriaceae bacterium]